MHPDKSRYHREAFMASASPSRRLMDAPLSDEERMMIFTGRVDRALAELQRANAEKNYKIEGLEREVARLKNDAVSTQAQAMQTASQKGALLLIDGSGSMTMDPNPIEAALRAAKHKRIGGAVLWGDRKPLIIDIKNEKQVTAAVRGLGSGSDLAPTLEVAGKLTGPQHFIIVSDGDLFDADKSGALLEAMLQRNPQVKLDVVIIAAQQYNRQPAMEKMIRDLKLTEGAQRPRIVNFDIREKVRDLGSVITTLVCAAGSSKKPATAPKP